MAVRAVFCVRRLFDELSLAALRFWCHRAQLRPSVFLSSTSEMSMQQVTVTVLTRQQSVPGGAQSAPFLFTLRNMDTSLGMPDLQQKSVGKSVVFRDVPEGRYIAVVSAGDVELTSELVVEGTTVLREVPDTITTQVGQPAPAVEEPAASGGEGELFAHQPSDQG